MKPSNLIVKIPEPCHEDWSKMKPDEKGRYCSSCSTSVVDFSNKTDAEIKHILLENKGQKMCGHFKKTQLNRPLNITVDLNDLPQNMSVTKVFTIALFIVFGSMLFSCTNEHDQVLGEISVKPPTEAIEKYVVGELAAPQMIEDSINSIKETPLMVKGETFVSGDVCIHEEYVEGELFPEEILQPEDSTKTQTDSITTTESTEFITVGMMIVEPVPADTSAVDSLVSRNNSSLTGENNNSTHTDLLVYPNPGNGEFTIKYDVTKRADVRLDIFDIKGALIKTIVNIPGQYEGKYNIPVSLTEVPSGIYFVNLINGDKKFTEKVVISR